MTTNNNQLTSREGFLAPAKRRYKVIPLHNGQSVRIRSLNEREKSAFEASILTTRGEPNRARVADLNRRLIVIALVDDAGNLLLGPDDVTSLEELDGRVTTALVEAIRDHCGFGKTDMEDLAKNSEAITAGDSPIA